MKNSYLSGVICSCILLLFTKPIYAVYVDGDPGNKLNVPSDFPATFHMDLLGIGNLIVELPDSNSPTGYTVFDTVAYDTQGTQILFGATAFDGACDPSCGTSELTLSSIDHWAIGTGAPVVGYSPSFYIDGAGSGQLYDNGDGTGQWTLNVPLYVDWNGGAYTFSTFFLTTNATYDVTYGDQFSGYTIDNIGGIAMDYITGDALLVGQAVIDDPSPFTGLRITLEIQGNDPVIAPIPPTVWLLGSGLLGLVGMARRKQA